MLILFDTGFATKTAHGVSNVRFGSIFVFNFEQNSSQTPQIDPAEGDLKLWHNIGKTQSVNRETHHRTITVAIGIAVAVLVALTLLSRIPASVPAIAEPSGGPQSLLLHSAKKLIEATTSAYSAIIQE